MHNIWLPICTMWGPNKFGCPESHTMIKMRCEHGSVERAACIVREGGVVVFPTDTVYGVGCDPYNHQAVRRIYEAKGRDTSKPFPILVDTIQTVCRIAHMGPGAAKLASVYWPGPLTIILEVTDGDLAAAMGLSGSVGVRIPGGDCISQLLKLCHIMVGTSANISGEPSPAGASDIHVKCDMLLDGGRTPGTESTIVDARGTHARVVRRGALEVPV